MTTEEFLIRAGIWARNNWPDIEDEPNIAVIQVDERPRVCIPVMSQEYMEYEDVALHKVMCDTAGDVKFMRLGWGPKSRTLVFTKVRSYKDRGEWQDSPLL